MSLFVRFPDGSVRDMPLEADTRFAEVRHWAAGHLGGERYEADVELQVSGDAPTAPPSDLLATRIADTQLESGDEISVLLSDRLQAEQLLLAQGHPFAPATAALAVEQGDLPLLQLCLRAQASPPQALLPVAIRTADLPAVNALLSHHPDVVSSLPDRERQQLLSYVLANPRDDIDRLGIVRLLVGAGVGVSHDALCSALPFPSVMRLLVESLVGNIPPDDCGGHDAQKEFASMVSAAGADESEDDSVLHFAAGFGALEPEAIESVKILLEHGADVSEHDCFGRSPLHAAVESGNTELAQALLTQVPWMAMHTSVDDWGIAHYACANIRENPCRGLALLQLCLDSKADPNARGTEGITPLHIAVSAATCLQLYNVTEVEDLMAGGGVGYDPAPEALRCVEVLVGRGADVNAQCSGGCTPLHIAESCYAPKLVAKLKELGADASIRAVDGRTAAQTGQIAEAARVISAAATTRKRSRSPSSVGDDGGSGSDEESENTLSKRARTAPGGR